MPQLTVAPGAVTRAAQTGRSLQSMQYKPGGVPHERPTPHVGKALALARIAPTLNLVLALARLWLFRYPQGAARAAGAAYHPPPLLQPSPAPLPAAPASSTPSPSLTLPPTASSRLDTPPRHRLGTPPRHRLARALSVAYFDSRAVDVDHAVLSGQATPAVPAQSRPSGPKLESAPRLARSRKSTPLPLRLLLRDRGAGVAPARIREGSQRHV